MCILFLKNHILIKVISILLIISAVFVFLETSFTKSNSDQVTRTDESNQGLGYGDFDLNEYNTHASELRYENSPKNGSLIQSQTTEEQERETYVASSNDIRESEIILMNSNIKFNRFILVLERKFESQKLIDIEYSLVDDQNTETDFVSRRLVIDERQPVEIESRVYDLMPFSLNESLNGDFKAIKLKVKNDKWVNSAKAHFIKDGSTYSRSTASENLKIGDVSIVSREGWGCNDNNPESSTYCDGPSWAPSYYDVSHIIVHHTAGSNTASNWADQVRSIWYYHATVLGWSDIGYNFLIDPNGVIYEGRYGGLGVEGGHAYSHNRGTIGVSMLGTYSDVNITPKARESLENLLAELHARTFRDLPDSNAKDITGKWNLRLTGHRDWNPTSCPGQTFYNTFDTLRARVKTKTQPIIEQIIAEERLEKAEEIKDMNYRSCPEGYFSEGDTCVEYEVIKDKFTNLDGITKIAKDNEENIFLLFKEKKQIMSIPSNYDVGQDRGKVIRKVLPGKPTDIVFDSNNLAYVMMQGSDYMVQIDVKNGGTTSDVNIGAVPERVSTSIRGTFYMSLDSDSSLYEISNTGASSKIVTFNEKIKDIKVNGDDEVYVLAGNNTLNKIVNGTLVAQKTFPGQNFNKLELSRDRVFVTNDKNLMEVNLNGQISNTFDISINPSEIFSDHKNTLTIHDKSSKKVVKVNVNEGTEEVINEVSGTVALMTVADRDIYYYNSSKGWLGVVDLTDNTVTKTVGIAAFNDESGKDWAYSYDRQTRVKAIEKLIGLYGWNYKGEPFYAYSCSTRQTSTRNPVYSFVKDHRRFFTNNRSEAAAWKSKSGWKYEGTPFCDKGLNDSDGRLPVYRFKSKVYDSYTYTINENEKNKLTNDSSHWQYEGVAFYAFK